MAPPASGHGGIWNWHDLRNGAILQTVEALTLGLPFEVIFFVELHVVS